MNWDEEMKKKMATRGPGSTQTTQLQIRFSIDFSPIFFLCHVSFSRLCHQYGGTLFYFMLSILSF